MSTSTLVYGWDAMAKAPQDDTPEGQELAPSGTLRLSTDLLEMMREICFHSRDNRGRRVKITQLADELFRPVVVWAYQDFQRAKSEGGRKNPKAK